MCKFEVRYETRYALSKSKNVFLFRLPLIKATFMNNQRKSIFYLFNFLKKVKPSHPYQRVHWDIQYYRASTALNVQEATWSPSVRQGIEHRYYFFKKYKVHTQNRQTRSDIWGNLYLVPSGNPLKETDGRMSSVYLRSTSPCVYVHLCRTELLNK